MNIKVEGISKTINTTPILKDINLMIDQGEMISLVGRSGSGKSTLLYIISSLDRPTSGKVYFDGIDLSLIDDDKIHSIRRNDIGFVFQFHYLLPEFNVLENVLMPTQHSPANNPVHLYAKEIIKQVGLGGMEHKHPSQLSGGEQQRVAIARALVMKPKCIFADEPTGNLDSFTGNTIMNLFKEINKNLGTTIVYVTHDISYANMASRKITIADGVILN